MLTDQQGQTLIRLARQQIEGHLGVTPTHPVAEAELMDPDLLHKSGVFVTLHKRGALRGCIGSLAAVESLLDAIRRHALNAAFHDHRFAALTSAELPELDVEVSVLTVPKPCAYQNTDELLLLLRPGVDGVILGQVGGASATFLPQVWQQLPAPGQFLDHLCRKAGLAETAWRTGDLAISTYQVQSFK